MNVRLVRATLSARRSAAAHSRHAIVALSLALVLETISVACGNRTRFLTLDNRTTTDVVVVTPSGTRWFIAACAKAAIDLSDRRLQLAPSASAPADSVSVLSDIYMVADSAVDPAITITSTHIFHELVLPSPCEGSPPADSRVR